MPEPGRLPCEVQRRRGGDRFRAAARLTDIIVGRPRRSILKSLLLGSPVDRLLRMAGDIDVHVITGGVTGSGSIPPSKAPHWPTMAPASFFDSRHRARFCHVPVLRSEQPHHGVLVGRAGHGHQLRTRACSCQFAFERSGFRFLLCAAALYLGRRRCPIHRHVRGHVSGRFGNKPPRCPPAARGRDCAAARAAGDSHARARPAARRNPWNR